MGTCDITMTIENFAQQFANLAEWYLRHITGDDSWTASYKNASHLDFQIVVKNGDFRHSLSYLDAITPQLESARTVIIDCDIAVMDFERMEPQTVNVKSCSACHGDHEQVMIQELPDGAEDIRGGVYTHYFLCPKTSETVYVNQKD